MHPGQIVPVEEEHDHVERGFEVVSAGLGVAEAGVEGREDEVAWKWIQVRLRLVSFDAILPRKQVVVAKAEVYKMNKRPIFGIDEDIIRLDVIMNDPDAVQVFESLVKLYRYHYYCFLWEVEWSIDLLHQIMQTGSKCLQNTADYCIRFAYLIILI